MACFRKDLQYFYIDLCDGFEVHDINMITKAVHQNKEKVL